MTTTVDALAGKFKADGFEVNMPPDNTIGYTFEAKKAKESVAVVVKEYKAAVNMSHVRQFQDYLEDGPGKGRFKAGWLISVNGFSKQAITHLETEEAKNIRVGTYSAGSLRWMYPREEADPNIGPPPQPLPPPPKLRYFGVFTCKGGVGKTTVAAHLAGAFALMGFNVVLVDLDPDRNLRKLFLRDPDDDSSEASIYVPPKGKGVGTTITVLNRDEWDEHLYPDIKIVVCDCSPVLSENPKDLVSKFDYCIIPGHSR